MMELKLKNQQINNVYKNDGSLERTDIQNEYYEIVIDDEVKGSANVYQNGFTMNLNFNDKSVEEVKEVLIELIGDEN